MSSIEIKHQKDEYITSRFIVTDRRVSFLLACRRYQTDPSIFHNKQQSVFVGECVGLILACTVASATDERHLAQLASETLNIVRRLTEFAIQRSREIEDRPGLSWAVAVQLPRQGCVDALENCKDHTVG